MRSVALACALCFLGIQATGCPSTKDDEKRVVGTEGRERWIVTFEGSEPDVSEYRRLMNGKPDEARAYADKMRKKLDQDHRELMSILESLSGTVVERWWMSNAMTVEIDAAKAPSLARAGGVKSIAPDVLLEP
jgi:hypothetical protein